MWTLKPEVIPLVSEVPEQHGKITESGSLPDLYTQIKRYKSTYLHLKVYGISDIARRSLLSDEQHLLFYSQGKDSHKESSTEDECKGLSIVDHSTFQGYHFTSQELQHIGWPQRCNLAAYHSGSMLALTGEMTLSSFSINLRGELPQRMPPPEIPDDFKASQITAISMDHQQVYIAFDTNPRKILIWHRVTNNLVARLTIPADFIELIHPKHPDLESIRDIVIRKSRIAAVTDLGHIAIWERNTFAKYSGNDIFPDCSSHLVDNLRLGLEETIDQISMSQDLERMIVLDPVWSCNMANVTPDAVQEIPARKFAPSEESFLRIDEECRIVAVGVMPIGVPDASTPKLKIYSVSEDKLLMQLAQFGPEMSRYLGQFLDFSLHQNSVNYYGTGGLVSREFTEAGESRPLKSAMFTCSRYIPLNLFCWIGMKNIDAGKILDGKAVTQDLASNENDPDMILMRESTKNLQITLSKVEASNEPPPAYTP